MSYQKVPKKIDHAISTAAHLDAKKVQTLAQQPKTISKPQNRISPKNTTKQTTYMVQIGILRNAKNANSYINEIKQKTKRNDIAYVKEAKGSSTIYRIIIGKNHNISEARRIVSSLEKIGITAFVKKR